MVEDSNNPFRTHILPLAYQNKTVLHALLGFTSCHLQTSRRGEGSLESATAIQYRISALSGLGSLLQKEEREGLSSSEEDFAFATVVLLVFHDVGALLFEIEQMN